MPPRTRSDQPERTRLAGEVGDGLAALRTRTAASTSRTESLRLRSEGLAAAAGIPPLEALQALEPPVSRERLLEAHRLAAGFYTEQLASDAGTGPRQYLQTRGVAWAMDHPEWKVGYAPRGRTALVNHLREWRFTDREIVASGLGRLTDDGRLIDRFRDRIMFGVRDPDDPARPVVAFVGRAAPNAGPDVPKYLNSPTSPIYHKSSLLFGLAEQRDQARAGGPAVLVEGPLDALAVAGAAAEAGAPAPIAVATCGTALTGEHVRALTTHAATEGGVVAAFDADSAGRKAAERAYFLLTPAYEQRATSPGRVLGLELPPGQDPASITQEPGGPQRLAALLSDQPRPLVELVVEHRIEAHGDRLNHIPGRLSAMHSVIPLIAERPPEHVVELARNLSDRLDLGADTVTNAIVDYYEGPSKALQALTSRARSPAAGAGAERPIDAGARAAVAAAAARISRGESVSAPVARRVIGPPQSGQERGR